MAKLERAQARLERARARPSTPATTSVAVAVRAAAADAARARESEQGALSERVSEMGRGASHFGCRWPWRGPLARHRRPRGTAARRRRARGAPSLWPVGHDARGARAHGRGRGHGRWAGVGRIRPAGSRWSLFLFFLKFLNLTQMQLFGKFRSFFKKSAQNKSCREFQTEQLSFRSQLKILNNF